MPVTLPFELLGKSRGLRRHAQPLQQQEALTFGLEQHVRLIGRQLVKNTLPDIPRFGFAPQPDKRISGNNPSVGKKVY